VRDRPSSRSGSHSRAVSRSRTRAPSVRYISKPVVSKTDWKKAEAFVKEVHKLPVYLIAGHSCICNKGGMCDGERHPFAFNLPENTYIVNMVQPGDYSCTIDSVIRINVDAIRKFLFVHDTDDIDMSDVVGKSRFSFFSGLQRAVGPSKHPNISYTFNQNGLDGKLLPREQNPYGVYNISRSLYSFMDINNSTSIIPQDPLRNNWSLKQIINQVYETEGIPKGIFISTGCLAACNSEGSETSMHEASMMMATANAEYRTHRETLTGEELDKKLISRPYNVGIHYPHSALDPKLVKEMAAEGLYDIKSFADAPLLFNHTNHAAMEGMMRKRFKSPASHPGATAKP
jgi:hypothetical protein